jgi:phosphatidylserine/phosphatidylglycerophosphate/cardiolipin synthase-like enzyme
VERARAGVKVRLLVKWLGSLMKSRPSLWREMRNAGIEVRTFGLPTIDSPPGWVSRDHRNRCASTARSNLAFALLQSMRNLPAQI